jgi:hydrogenase nickel incorporation protein HypB
MSIEMNSRFELNNQIARGNRAAFDAAGVSVISVVGPPGSGKTSLIESLICHLDRRVRTAAIVGNLAATRQVERITRQGCRAMPLVIDNLSAVNIRDTLSEFNLADIDLLLIESEANYLSPVQFNLGQHFRAGVFSVAGGDDKATEYPFLVAESDVVLLTKIDLLKLVSFDFKVFGQDVNRIKPKTPIIQLSNQSRQGVARWIDWVDAHLSPKGRARAGPQTVEPFVNFPS